MNEYALFGNGMAITRTVDGERVTLETLNPEVMKRIEKLARMNRRREKYLAAGNRRMLLRLANEYEKEHMPTMARAVRKEARHFAKEKREKNTSASNRCPHLRADEDYICARCGEVVKKKVL